MCKEMHSEVSSLCVGGADDDLLTSQNLNTATFSLSVLLRGRGLFLGGWRAWNHGRCCRLAEIFVSAVGGLKQQRALKALTFLASARTPAF